MPQDALVLADTNHNYDSAEEAVRGKSPPVAPIQSNEVLFLKRLMFLKAAIDNEDTINTFSVPFE